MHTKGPARIFSGIAIALIFAAPLQAPAQQQGGEQRAGVIEEITVTAQKREQSLQDVPIAISAYDSAARTSPFSAETYRLVR